VAKPAHAERLVPIERGTTPSLVAAIEERLRQLLMDGGIAAGGKLNECALAQQWEISRSALREAVRRLEQSGLVTIVPNRGVFVRRVGLKEVLDLFDVHAGLARSAGRLVATRITDAQLAMLEECSRAMNTARDAGQVGAYYALNSEFHRNLIAFSGNDRLISLHGAIASELQLSRCRNLGSGHQVRESAAEHERILEGVRARDPRRTARAFEEHVLSGKQRMINSLSIEAAD